MHERALVYAVADAWLYGVVSLPAPGTTPPAVGVVIVVGGPQYRAGSHRQFTLLARSLATAGVPALRFDQRGMGDSEGEAPGFEHLEQDLRATIDRFLAEVPGLERVVLWGLCDGATAAALYAPQDDRVAGVALLNPWVRTEQGAARAAVRHYYRARLFDRTLWRKVASGRFGWRAALASFWRTLVASRSAATHAAGRDDQPADLPQRMHAALRRFEGKVLVMLSGADLTAREFEDLGAGPGPWRQLLAAARFTHLRLEQADHTLSRREWHDQAIAATRNWLHGL